MFVMFVSGHPSWRSVHVKIGGGSQPAFAMLNRVLRARHETPPEVVKSDRTTCMCRKRSRKHWK